MELTIITAKNGELTLVGKDGERQVYLHSAFNPSREAERWVDNVEADEKGVFFVCGGGLGYHLKLLRKKFPEAHIVLVEPDRRLSDIGRANYAELLKDPKFHYLIDLTSQEIAGLIGRTAGIYNLNRVHLLKFEPICRMYSEFFQHFRTIFFEALSRLSVDINTLLKFAMVWPVNFFRNFRHIIMNPLVSDLFGAFRDVPAIIVSAGPSLSKNIGDLKEAKGKALIIAVGTALKVLLAKGVEPDLVISVDGGVPNYRHFENVKGTAPLVFDVGIYPQIIEEYAGPKWVACCDRYLLSWFQEALNLEITELKPGPSVANIALDLASRLDCNPIILIGQDLAYTDGRSHAAGTVYQDVNPMRPGRQLIPVEDINGGTVYTDRVFLSMLRWFEKEIALLPERVKVIDATEGGARIAGTMVVTLRQAVEDYCTTDCSDKIALFVKSHRERRLTAGETGEVIRKLQEIVEGLQHMSEIGAQGIKLSEEMKHLYEKLHYLNAKKRRRLSAVLGELDKVDRRLSEAGAVAEMFVVAFQPLLMQLYNAESLKGRPDETEQEAGIRLAGKSLLLYRGIEGTAAYLRPVVEQALAWARSNRME